MFCGSRSPDDLLFPGFLPDDGGGGLLLLLGLRFEGAPAVVARVAGGDESGSGGGTALPSVVPGPPVSSGGWDGPGGLGFPASGDGSAPVWGLSRLVPGAAVVPGRSPVAGQPLCQHLAAPGRSRRLLRPRLGFSGEHPVGAGFPGQLGLVWEGFRGDGCAVHGRRYWVVGQQLPQDFFGQSLAGALRVLVWVEGQLDGFSPGGDGQDLAGGGDAAVRASAGSPRGGAVWACSFSFSLRAVPAPLLGSGYSVRPA